MSTTFSSAEARQHAAKLPDSALLKALLITIPPGATVLDVGAGGGRYTRALIESGRPCKGFDGADRIEEVTGGLVRHAELCTPGWQPAEWHDWAICIEVGEHVPEPLLAAFLDQIAAVRVRSYVISWAVPGQRGRRHVSCRTPEWVAEQMQVRGWILDADATRLARAAASPSGFASKLLIFRAAK